MFFNVKVFSKGTRLHVMQGITPITTNAERRINFINKEEMTDERADRKSVV